MLAYVMGDHSSIEILENFFGGELGRDFDREAFTSLPPEQWPVLQERLCEHLGSDDLGSAGAEAWLASHDVSARATTFFEKNGSVEHLAAAVLYLPQVLFRDPLQPSPLMYNNSQQNFAWDVHQLEKIYPLVKSGAVTLFPGNLGYRASEYLSPQSPDRDACASDLWPAEIQAWTEELHHVLPQGQVGEIAWAISSELVAAAALDVDVAAYGQRLGLDVIQPSLRTAGLRTARFCDVLLPNFSGLSVSDVAAVRQSSEGFALVRGALEHVIDALPEDHERALRLGPQIAEEVLEPAIESLRKETKRSPTLAAAIGSGWTLTTAGVDLIAHQLSPGTGAAAAAAPIALFADWIWRRRKARGTRAALRVLQTFNRAS